MAQPVTPPETAAPSLTPAGSAVRTDATQFIDSVRVGDTVSFKRGYRVIMTVIDSTCQQQVKANAKVLGFIARTRPYTNCIQR